MESVKFFKENSIDVSKNIHCRELINIVSEITEFMYNFWDSTFTRSISLYRAHVVVDRTIIIESAVHTLESVRTCCETGRFSDAYILLRRYRDDLFYYVFLKLVEENNPLITEDGSKQDFTKEEKTILDWINNTQDGLHIGTVLSYIASKKSVNKFARKYKLQERFARINDRLNKFVHGNGVVFYNRTFLKMVCEGSVEKTCLEIKDYILYITVSFIIIVSIVSPTLISAEDYIDYLDNRIEPPKDAQYWIVPFVTEFIEKHKTSIDEDILDFFRSETGMC